MSKRRPYCPQCVSNKIVPIIYGMPTEYAWEKSKQGKLLIGGCCVSDESPKWYCQACGHEFGKYMPSIDDLPMPVPEFNWTKPLKLEFSIGGFDMPAQYCVILEGETLKYGLGFGSKLLEIITEVKPTDIKWANFKNKLYEIGVWDWKRRYHNPHVLDGTQWDLLIDYGFEKIKTSGSNRYPGYVDKYGMTETTEFKKFLHALSLLLGGVKIA